MSESVSHQGPHHAGPSHTKDMARHQKAMPERESLRHLYEDAVYTLPELAEHFKVSAPTAREWLLRYNIPLRTRSEAQYWNISY